MPTPLFPFVWQYSNQPIEVLAEDVASVIVNTIKVIPVVNDNANGFIDSTLTDDAVSLRTRYLAGPNVYEDKGLKLDYVGGKYTFGDYTTADNGSRLAINDAVQTLQMITKSGAGPAVTFFGLDGLNATLLADSALTAATAGAAAALFLKVDIAGVPYKIQLLNV